MPDEPNTPPVPPFEIYPVPPELLAFAQQTLNMEELMEDIREIEAGRGVSFETLIAEVEAILDQP